MNVRCLYLYALAYTEDELYTAVGEFAYVQYNLSQGSQLANNLNETFPFD